MTGLMNGQLLALVLALVGDGDPEPRQLTLSLARPNRSAENLVSFDLEVRWPSAVKVTPAQLATVAPRCVTTLTLPDGTKPKLTTTVTATAPQAFVAHVEYPGVEAAGPAEWALTVTCPDLDSGPQPQRFGVFGAPANAWLVIASGAKTEAEAVAWLAEKQRGIGATTWNTFPKVVDSQWVLGLTPGFFIVVLAATDSEAVAKTLAKAMTDHDGAGTYVKKAWWTGPLDARLLVVEQVIDSERVVPDAVDGNEIFLMQKPYDNPAHVRGRSRVWSDGSAVLVYSRMAGGTDQGQLAISAPQTSCEEEPRVIRLEPSKRVQHVKKLSVKCVQGD